MAHIDWLTIVGRRNIDERQWTVTDSYRTAAEALVDQMTSFIEVFGNPQEWEIVRGRAPYSHARRSHDATRTLYVHPLATHFTLEVSGQHCAKIAALMPAVLGAFHADISRLDIAVDMETKVTPVEFDAAIKEGRVKTHSIMRSSTGETVYRGSRSSERFARVYRYNAPHPRAHLLRAEFQLKADYAREAALQYVQGITLDGLAAGLGAHFGFDHPVWNNRAIEPVKLKVATHAQSGDTVAWLTRTVAPLLRRLEREGKLDIDAWLDAYVRNDE